MQKAARAMLKTINAIESNKQQKEIFVISNTDTPERTPERMKTNGTSQEDVMHDFAQDNGYGFDSEENKDEVERYARAKLVFSKDESLWLWWRK